MPCSNPEHDHWWVGTFTPLEPSPDTEPKSKSPIPKINGRLVITVEPCERMCGFCPVNERTTFRSAQKMAQHANRAHKDVKTDGTVVQVRQMEDHGRRPGAKGVSMRDSDKKYEWRDGSWERRDQEEEDEEDEENEDEEDEDEEDEDELDPLSTKPEMDDDDENYDAKHKVGDAIDEDSGYGDELVEEGLKDLIWRRIKEGGINGAKGH